MKPAGVFEVCPTPINYNIYTDWIQAGETFHLSEGLRGLIARDAYPHFKDTNSFTLPQIKSWLNRYLAARMNELTYINNR